MSAPPTVSRLAAVPRSLADAGHPVSRRSVLLATGALLLSAGAGGCGVFDGPGTPPAPAQPDPLLPLAAAARTEADLARDVAVAVPQQAAALAAITSDRAAHAQALDAEISRAASQFSPPAPSSPSASVPPGPTPPSVEQLRTSLQRSRDAAAQLARSVPAYRAGLLGSIAAACATELAVLL